MSDPGFTLVDSVPWLTDSPIVWSNEPAIGIGERFRYDLKLDADDSERCGRARPDVHARCILMPGHDCPHLAATDELIRLTSLAVTGLRLRAEPPSVSGDV